MGLKAWKLLGGTLAAVCAVALAFAALVGGCDTCIETSSGGCAHMACFYTFHAVALLELLAGFTIAGVAVVKCKMGRRWLACTCILAQALACIAIWTPAGGICANAGMACHAPAVAVTVLGVIVCIGCVVAIALADPKRAELPKRGL